MELVVLMLQEKVSSVFYSPGSIASTALLYPLLHCCIQHYLRIPILIEAAWVKIGTAVLSQGLYILSARKKTI